MQKVLIANRGEIARRIIRTCQERGVKTVAVYSEADKDLPYVSAADESRCIGEPPVAKSYLQMDKMIEVAKEVGADAIHPGYGLLSENDEFARKVIQEGIIWIGPDPEVIALMGDKVVARQTMQNVGVPVVPGADQISTIEDAVQAAEQIGLPVMIKASAGGGGIGMYVCHTLEDVKQFFPTAQSRAKAYFGNDRLFIEKWVSPSRHVEVQIIADASGQVLHLYERECSVQRRNQKVIEESLSPSISSETRIRLHEMAIQAAQAVQYTGVGTVEFLVGPNDEFYFLEMNTRLQVEHPVTECITELDLVSLQLDLAMGNNIPFSQDEVRAKGHAMEFRICAEDPKQFIPSPGKISRFRIPKEKGIRVDAGVKEGSVVTPFYDSLIAKCIVSGSNREEVLEKSKQALQSFEIEGIKTNIPTLIRVLEESKFVQGNYHTQLLKEMGYKA
ncbi:biotin carboxylase [Thermoflavimicrobium daqui]|uniref:biotin carboxylase n=1 Tax=Thermoflavimicrobium daqui TaxID=2137476 RepID=A0A364K6Z9_9BACL|nr:acetyl-CoA carboxylase biotin carboxylase subunit [Thermoflavimicrobium daqui]RAL26057.1 biotin carboxylase [Thermoflavimicrobium daqui]